MKPNKKRCLWAQVALSAKYHDKEWGRPVHDDRVLFELLNARAIRIRRAYDSLFRENEVLL